MKLVLYYFRNYKRVFRSLAMRLIQSARSLRYNKIRVNITGKSGINLKNLVGCNTIANRM